jgi:hypothetical protein
MPRAIAALLHLLSPPGTQQRAAPDRITTSPGSVAIVLQRCRRIDGNQTRIAAIATCAFYSQPSHRARRFPVAVKLIVLAKVVFFSGLRRHVILQRTGSRTLSLVSGCVSASVR